jgi:hypothetical protein
LREKSLKTLTLGVDYLGLIEKTEHMDWKKYLVRAVKFVMYFYILGLLLYYVMYVVGGNPLSSLPDFSTLFTPRLIFGLTLLGVCYPLLGFKSVSIQLPEGGWEKHGKALHEAMSQCRLKFKSSEEGKLIFGAEMPMRRVFTMFEDEVTLEINNGSTLLIKGLRKDVAHVRLRVDDYLRRIS